jgi:hypothetical protein
VKRGIGDVSWTTVLIGVTESSVVPIADTSFRFVNTKVQIRIVL